MKIYGKLRERVNVTQGTPTVEQRFCVDMYELSRVWLNGGLLTIISYENEVIEDRTSLVVVAKSVAVMLSIMILRIRSIV